MLAITRDVVDGYEEIDADGYSDSFFTDMVVDEPFEFTPHPEFPNWFLGPELGPSGIQLSYHISWLVPVEDENS